MSNKTASELHRELMDILYENFISIPIEPIEVDFTMWISRMHIRLGIDKDFETIPLNNYPLAV